MINYELDLLLLKLFTKRALYLKYCSFINLDHTADEIKIILKSYSNWYKEFNRDCDYSVFVPWFFNSQHADFLKSEQEHYRDIFSRILSIEDQDIEVVLESLKYQKLGYDIFKYIVGDELQDIPANLKKFDALKLERLLHKFNTINLKAEKDFFTHDLTEVFEEPSEVFFASKLKGINRIMGGYQKGWFHLICGGVDSGKSAFVINEAVNLLPQLKYDERIFYFNNEQPDKSILKRIASAAMNKKLIGQEKKLMSKLEFEIWVRHNQKLAQQGYHDSGADRIELIHTKSFNHIVNLCTQHRPKVIIIDQIDNLLSFSKGEGSARPYNDLYSEIRDFAQEYGTVLGCTQASNNGKWPDSDKYKERLTLSDMHWSRVDKQAHCDTFIGIGVSNSYPDSERYINIDRNKDGSRGGFQCIIQPEVSRYID